MSTLELVPGLTVDEVMFETAAEGVRVHAPHLPALSRADFYNPLRWALIPNEHGALSKAEMVLARTPDNTDKLNLWFAEDDRAEKPVPHNHPQVSCVGRILAGGYVEDRYSVNPSDGQVLATLGVEHVAGQANRMDKALFHEVTEVLPGTMSLFTCTAWTPGDWGYLDIDTGVFTPSSEYQPVADFAALFDALNPQHRKD